MAQHDIGAAVGGYTVVDKRDGTTDLNPLSLAFFAATQDLTKLDAFLNSYSSTLYPQATLDSMNLNDKVYAARLVNDLAGV